MKRNRNSKAFHAMAARLYQWEATQEEVINGMVVRCTRKDDKGMHFTANGFQHDNPESCAESLLNVIRVVIYDVYPDGKQLLRTDYHFPKTYSWDSVYRFLAERHGNTDLYYAAIDEGKVTHYNCFDYHRPRYAPNAETLQSHIYF